MVVARLQVHEIKRLTAAITTIRSELNKYEEQLEDCRKYKEFLDNLTPPEFFKEQAAAAAQRRQARLSYLPYCEFHQALMLVSSTYKPARRAKLVPNCDPAMEGLVVQGACGGGTTPPFGQCCSCSPCLTFTL